MLDFKEKYSGANAKIKAPEELKEAALNKVNASTRFSYKKYATAAVAVACAVCLLIAVLPLKNAENNPPLASNKEQASASTSLVRPTFKSQASPLTQVSNIKSEDTYSAYSKDVPDDLYSSYNDFALESGQIILSQNPGENRLYSPLSLYNALGMLSASSSGKTQSEILSVMNLSTADNIDKLMSGFMFSTVTGGCDIKNSVWLNQNISYNKKTLDRLAGKYRTEAYKMDFSSADAPKEISHWINKNTNGLLSYEPTFTANDVAKFVNTIYFKNEWQSNFSSDHNTIEIFTKDDGSIIDCVYMNTKTFDVYYETSEAVFASLPMKNSYQMVFALPKGDKTPANLINNKETLKTLINWNNTSPSWYYEVEWSVPKFRVDGDYDLVKSLNDLGVKTAFGAGADFSPLSTDVGAMFVSSALQQSTLSIDEEGCEAATFTLIDLNGTGLPQTTVKMTLNRPFLFAVVNNNGPLFIGAVEKPFEV